MSWKLPGKLLCITLFFTSCHWYNIVVYLKKKNAFQSTKNFRRIQWQNMLRMHLLQSIISKFSGKGPLYPPSTREGPPLGLFPTVSAALGSCLRHSTLSLLYKLRLLLQFFLRTLIYMCHVWLTDTCLKSSEQYFSNIHDIEMSEGCSKYLEFIRNHDQTYI